MITNTKTRVIVYANTYASDVYAVELDKLVGSPIDIIYTNEEQREKILEAMDKEGKLNNFKTTYKKSDGSYIEALLSIVPVTYMHESCRMGIVSDITELKNIQDELEYLNHTLEERIKEEVEKNKRQQLILFHQSPPCADGGDDSNDSAPVEAAFKRSFPVYPETLPEIQKRCFRRGGF